MVVVVVVVIRKSGIAYNDDRKSKVSQNDGTGKSISTVYNLLGSFPFKPRTECHPKWKQS